jgi:hypothetical protein
MGILLTFMASWGLPAQAYFAAPGNMSAQASCCPDCQTPCCNQDQDCARMAACAVSMLPAIDTPAQSLDKAVHAPTGILDYLPKIDLATVATAPIERTPDYSPSTTVNIRFCTFQE